MSERFDVLAVLRNCDASTDARYFPADFGPSLVKIQDAMQFKSKAAAERFLKQMPELKGYVIHAVSRDELRRGTA